MKRRIFRALATPEEALKKLQEHYPLEPIGIEHVPLLDAQGRILAETIISSIDVPGFSRSRMDGYAVRSEDTVGADEESPITLPISGKVKTGHKPTSDLEPGTAMEISTGAVIPKGADAVIMVEFTHKPTDTQVQLFQTVTPGQYIIFAGTDIAVGELILPKGSEIRTLDVGTLAAIGTVQVPVYQKPKVAILATGDEVMALGNQLVDSAVYDINSYAIGAGVKDAGGTPHLIGIAKDNQKSMRNQLKKAIEYGDIVITSGSTSAGIDDMMYQIIDDLGPPGIIIHGIAIRPGKPTIIGVVENKLVIGLPGYPTSAMTVFRQLVNPIIRQVAGKPPNLSQTKFDGVLAFDIRSQRGRRMYQPVSITKGKDGLKIIPAFTGSSAISTLANSDGYIVIPENINFIPKGTPLSVVLFDPSTKPSDMSIIGSHSLALDVLIEYLKSNSPHFSIKRIIIGSLGGLHAVGSGSADIAGIHLLDETTQEYNLPFIKKHNYQKTVKLIRGFKRPQGLIVAKGNPKKINKISDLLRKDVWFVNRNPGSGTRILLDQLLRKNTISLEVAREKIKGYTIEVKTHSAIASAIRHGRADVGLGIRTVAAFNNLDFIEISLESYDFAVSSEYISSSRYQRWLTALQSSNFHNALKNKMPWIVIPADIGQELKRNKAD